MSDQLTAEVLAEMKRLESDATSPSQTRRISEEELGRLMIDHASALIAAAEREKEQANQIRHMTEAADESLEQIGVLNTELERAQKRIAELEHEADHAEEAFAVKASQCCDLKQRIAELEAALGEIKSLAIYGVDDIVKQALKGGAK